MRKKNQSTITHWLSVIVIGISLGLALQFVRAWTEPTAAPPGGNVGAPINTSATAQTKEGNLNVNGGMVIGGATGGYKGTGTINASQFCLGGVCISAWPTGGTTGGTTVVSDPGHQLYQCPNTTGGYGSNCTGQVATYSTCTWTLCTMTCGDPCVVGSCWDQTESCTPF